MKHTAWTFMMLIFSHLPLQASAPANHYHSSNIIVAPDANQLCARLQQSPWAADDVTYLFSKTVWRWLPGRTLFSFTIGT